MSNVPATEPPLPTPPSVNPETEMAIKEAVGDVIKKAVSKEKDADGVANVVSIYQFTIVGEFIDSKDDRIKKFVNKVATAVQNALQEGSIETAGMKLAVQTKTGGGNSYLLIPSKTPDADGYYVPIILPL